MTHARREALAIAFFTVLGACFRLTTFGRLGLCHFDEGIYAIAGLWPTHPAGLASLDPHVIPYYSPPGFPILIGLAYLVLPWGISDLSAIAVAELCAIATIAVVGWIGRRTFGHGAGAAAAALAAWSGQHMAFSRMAMTDAPFLLAWLVAMGLGGRFLDRPTVGRALALGVAVGVAMNLKYNGWLAGVIVAIAALPGTREGRGRTLALLTLAAVVAAGLYLPWFLFVNGHDGYPSLLRHQRSYAGGLSTWYPHLVRQLEQSAALSGDWLQGSTVAFVASWAILSATVWTTAPKAGGSSWTSRVRQVGFGATVAMAFWPACVWSLASISVVSARGVGPSRRLLAVAWVLLTLLTPFYHPYARLWLPVLSTCWLILGGSLAEIAAQRPDAFHSARHWGPARNLAFLATVVLAIVTLVVPRFGPLHARPGLLGPRDGLRVAVTGDLAPRLRGLSSGPLVVLARPSALFYLASSSDRPFRRLPDLDTLLRLDDDSHWALLDAALLAQEPSLAGQEDPAKAVAVRLRERGWVERARFAAPADLPTLLDIELGNPAVRRAAREPTDLLLFERPTRVPPR